MIFLTNDFITLEYRDLASSFARVCAQRPKNSIRSAYIENMRNIFNEERTIKPELTEADLARLASVKDMRNGRLQKTIIHAKGKAQLVAIPGKKNKLAVEFVDATGVLKLVPFWIEANIMSKEFRQFLGTALNISFTESQRVDLETLNNALTTYQFEVQTLAVDDEKYDARIGLFLRRI